MSSFPSSSVSLGRFVGGKGDDPRWLVVDVEYDHTAQELVFKGSLRWVGFASPPASQTFRCVSQRVQFRFPLTPEQGERAANRQEERIADPTVRRVSMSVTAGGGMRGRLIANRMLTIHSPAPSAGYREWLLADSSGVRATLATRADDPEAYPGAHLLAVEFGYRALIIALSVERPQESALLVREGVIGSVP